MNKMFNIGMKIFDCVLIVAGAGTAAAGAVFLADDINTTKEAKKRAEQKQTGSVESVESPVNN